MDKENIWKRVARALNENPERVIQHLNIPGKKNGRFWDCGDMWGGSGKSTKINLSGNMIGKVMDFAANESGDLLDIWGNIRGLSRLDALKDAAKFLGINDEKILSYEKSYKPFPVKKAESMESPGDEVMNDAQLWLMSRGITAETTKKFDVRYDEASRAAVFPHKTISGAFVNASYRIIGEKKIWQEKDCAPCLFGWHTMSDKELEGGSVVICEGHIDALSWNQCGWPALSVPAGTGLAWIEQEWGNLEIFDRIMLSFDMDKAGQDTVQKLAKRLGLWRCALVELPEKDANDVLVNNSMNAKEVLERAIMDAKMYTAANVVSALDKVEEIKAFLNPVEGLEEEQRHIHLQTGGQKGLIFVPGRMTVWTGHPNHGKSTFLSWLLTLEVEKGNSIFNGSFEEDARVSQSMFLQQLTMTENLSNEQIEETCRNIAGRAFWFDQVGYINQDELFEGMEYCYRRFGVKIFVVDNLMMIAIKDDEDQKNFLLRVKAFCKEFESHVHIVCHPRKTDDKAPTMYDIKGLAEIAGLTDNIVVVHRPDVKSESDATDVYSRKQRHFGWLGRFRLYHTKATRSYSKIQSEESMKQDEKKKEKNNDQTEL